MAGGDRVEVREDALLDIHPLRNRLDDEVHVTERVVLETQAKGRHEYTAWRADTPDTRGRGLMYVAALTDDQAMIFVYDEPQRVSMWMKNTYLSLDMLFVDARGCIVHVAERARPAAVHGAKIGDRIRRPEAAWPADARGGC